MPKSLFNKVRDMATKKNIPLVCHFDLSYQCNLRCVHCYIVTDTRPELKTNEVTSILEQLARAGTLYLTLSGGELFTRKDLFEIATFAWELHFALRLLTNGTMIGQKEAEAIARLHPEKVGISIYSTHAAIHDGVTGVPGSLERSIAAARALRHAGVKVKLSTVIMKQNLHVYQAVFDLAHELGAEVQADCRLALKSNMDSSPRIVALIETALVKCFRMVCSLRIPIQPQSFILRYLVPTPAGPATWPPIFLPMVMCTLRSTSADVRKAARAEFRRYLDEFPRHEEGPLGQDC